MTRKDYILIAEVFNHRMTEHKRTLSNIGITVENEQVYAEELAIGDTIGEMATKLAYRLAKDNAAFDRKRFIEACGVL